MRAKFCLSELSLASPFDKLGKCCVKVKAFTHIELLAGLRPKAACCESDASERVIKNFTLYPFVYFTKEGLNSLLIYSLYARDK